MLFFSALAKLIIHYFRVITDFESGFLFGGLEIALILSAMTIGHRKGKVRLKATLEKALNAQ